jgi:Icc-related predicted phosphoesterase
MPDVSVVAISDLHGYLPEDLPACDLLLIAGDICPLRDHSPPAQAHWLGTTFREWLDRQPAREIVATWGNHDFIGERAPELVPSLRWHMLRDQGVELLGVKIYGTPWQPWFFDWAFNLYEPELQQKWKLIPQGTDILLLHGPPHGFGDMTVSGQRTGSPSLTRRIAEIKPQLAVFGHIHEGYGVFDLDGTALANVSLLNVRYEPVNRPFVTRIQLSEARSS